MEFDNTTREIIDGLDHGVRPQDDLFRHVNGTWLEETEIPADQASTGGFMDLHLQAERDVRDILVEVAQNVSENPGAYEGTNEEKIANLYESFMDEGRINGLGNASLRQDFDLIFQARDKDDLEIVVGQLYATGVTMPFGVSIEADRNDPHAYIPWLYQSGLGLPDEAYYRDPTYAEILDAYREFIPTLFSLAVGEDDSAAKTAAEMILDFETKLASHHMSVVDSRDADKTNNVMTWSELKETAPGFDWDAALDAMDLWPSNAPEFIVMNPDALAGFGKEWQEADLAQLKAYLRWQVVLARAPYLSDDIVATHFNFYGKVLSGTQVQRDRWKRGVSLVNSVLGEAVGQIYVERHFPPSHKEKMEQLVADLIEAYRESITNLDWMTEETKTKALAKLDTTVTKIGYPNKWRDYSALKITDALMSNIRRAARFEHDRNIAKLGTKVDRGEWFMNPQTVNAYYNPVANEIVFPAAILQPPFFDADTDPAYNYGGIGAVIGHEIGHGFDDQGSKYDGEGRLNNWWTDEDRTEFDKRTGALVGQYNEYTPAQLAGSEHRVNGEFTLGENIGDLGGLSIALKAYDIAMKREGHDGAADAPVIAGYTGIQRVFLNWARIWQSKRRDEIAVQLLAVDPHSPAEFRCNGVVKNVDAFHEAFEVQEGDALWLDPAERVRIW
ncbi:M13 family metallopeptidase [Trueperella bialowiezensis]|uniref:Neutral endopeptidase n=1 Tax=Trueperella bialowiezensis TaxID=312285 RepID=A0A3S4V9R4_9ACTO|nr:M13-type metalloendopeptidase [Trueperella bialowiezensis]VEI12731.1 Neutral endopeptidase [Trueperella bialowiezensis]